MISNELTYWYTFNTITKISNKRKNEIYIACYNNIPRLTIIDLFSREDIYEKIQLTSEEINLLNEAKSSLINNSFLVEDLLAQGYSIIPIHNSNYPKTLKQNLKLHSPIVLFTKGHLDLLQEKAVAIVGSRKAIQQSLDFTNNIVQKEVTKNNIIVSGYAKGVDRQALEAALYNKGRSIIVLPQGITTFSSGFKKYYKNIIQGDLLVISQFLPKSPWLVSNAMARNSTIYGLAKEIFIAQSSDSGGTWQGAIDGLKRKQKIFIFNSQQEEYKAHSLLINKGAIPVDFYGNEIPQGNNNIIVNNEPKSPKEDNKITEKTQNSDKESVLNNKETKTNSDSNRFDINSIKEDLTTLFSNNKEKTFNIKELIKELHLKLTDKNNLLELLHSIDNVQINKKGKGFNYQFKIQDDLLKGLTKNMNQ